MRLKGFYRAFEERHRGSRESIKNRLRIYLPFVVPLLEFHETANALDLGCGRGEWLELMRDIGFEVRGIDLDQDMLQSCSELSLPILCGDAVSCLKEMDSEAISVISGFHIIEHISFEALQELVAESMRVLRPGGLLILETPNPENIVVGTNSFYLDPTHIKPIPPDLLAFLLEYAGFQRSIVLRMQESEHLASRQMINLLDVLAGVSPDYAIVAQKFARSRILEKTDEVFGKGLGVSLHMLAKKFDEELRSTLERIENKVNASESRAQQAEDKAEQALIRAQRAEAWAEQIYHKSQQLEVKSQQAEEAINAMRVSTSWKVTKPLRISGKALIFLRNSGRTLLKTIYSKNTDKGQLISDDIIWTELDMQNTPSLGQAHLTARARDIYQRLRRTIEKNN
jgi:SAM-dependent methyltransferase